MIFPSYQGVAGLSFTARIERPPFHRGGSASKKDSLAAPPFPSEGARSGSKESSSRPCASPSQSTRCASTGDQRATLPRILTPFSVSDDSGLARNRGRRDLDKRRGQFPTFRWRGCRSERRLAEESSGATIGYFLRRNHETSTASHASPKPPMMV